MTPQRIMLVDNEEGLCRMMEAVLMDQGYQVKSFTRPVQAVAEFSAGDYQLIISDIKMPEMDGLEVLQHIRNRDPEVPVIMITAYATVEMSIPTTSNPWSTSQREFVPVPHPSPRPGHLLVPPPSP